MSNMRIITCALAAAGVFCIGSQAMAQASGQIFACVSQQGGVRLVAQNSTCSQNETLVTWNVVGPQGPAGPAGPAGQALAARSFICPGATVAPNGPLTFADIGYGASFGTSISAPTGGMPFTSILLQPGVYDVHLDGTDFRIPSDINARLLLSPFLNGSTAQIDNWWVTFAATSAGVSSLNISGGDRLITVSQPNSSFGIFNYGASSNALEGACTLNIMQLH
jgi:hypothetical protein